MRKLVFILFLATGVSGCIKLQVPDDIVSDTVQAGRDIYDDSRSDDENAPAEGGTKGQSIFTHTVVGPSDSLESELRERCLSELKTRTEELLESNDVIFTVMSESITIRDDKAIVSCTTSIE